MIKKASRPFITIYLPKTKGSQIVLEIYINAYLLLQTMKISFFEEFSTKSNMRKLSLVEFSTTVYIAAKSFREFEKIRKSNTQKNVQSAYWPVLEKEEGYWLSPFSSTQALRRILSEVKGKNVKIMWDAELPFRHPWLFLRLDNFLRNKPIIKKHFRKNGRNILTSEYPVRNKFIELMMRMLGVYFSPKKYGNKKIVMYYTSMHKKLSTHFLHNITELHKMYGKNLQVGLGTIATGILGNEPILSPENLERDLKEMKKIGIEEVVIFRLGGLNKEYVKILKQFV